MTKKSKIVRAAITDMLHSPRSTDAERDAARAELDRMSRNTSATRLHNRDAVDGRARGYLRAFGLSRVRMREMAHRSELPGVTKSSR